METAFFVRLAIELLITGSEAADGVAFQYSRRTPKTNSYRSFISFNSSVGTSAISYDSSEEEIIVKNETDTARPKYIPFALTKDVVTEMFPVETEPKIPTMDKPLIIETPVPDGS